MDHVRFLYVVCVTKKFLHIFLRANPEDGLMRTELKHVTCLVLYICDIGIKNYVQLKKPFSFKITIYIV